MVQKRKGILAVVVALENIAGAAAVNAGQLDGKDKENDKRKGQYSH